MSDMTPSEAGEVLTVASGYDNRTVGEAEMALWAEALPGVRIEDARRAVIQHYTDSTEWLKPAHINQIVRAWNRERARDVPPVIPPWQLADEPAREIEWIRVWEDAHLAGHTEGRAREIANHQMQISEDEPLAIDAGPAAAIKAQMEADALELVRKQSLREADARERAAEKRERYKRIRASELEAQKATTPAAPRDEATPTSEETGA